MARDLILVHGYGATIERGTRDVDFAINVQTWEQFEQLKSCLLNVGFIAHKSKIHQLLTTDPQGLPWEIDIIPFGQISDTQSKIAWPPEQKITMTVLGFTEAYENSMQVCISQQPDICIPVCSPAAMLLLKLISWSERDNSIRPKDAADIYYLLQHYSKITSIFDDLYEQGYMEIQGWDEAKASAMKLAHDSMAIASEQTLLYLQNNLFNQDQYLNLLAREMSRVTIASYEECKSYLVIILQQFQTVLSKSAL